MIYSSRYMRALPPTDPFVHAIVTIHGLLFGVIMPRYNPRRIRAQHSETARGKGEGGAAGQALSDNCKTASKIRSRTPEPKHRNASELKHLTEGTRKASKNRARTPRGGTESRCGNCGNGLGCELWVHGIALALCVGAWIVLYLTSGEFLFL